MNIKNIIDGVMSGMNQRNTTVTTILNDYRKDVAAATEEASYFKDEAGELSRRKAALIADARQRIAAADQRFADLVKSTVPTLRKELSGYLTTPANPALLEQLRVYTDFDMKMSREELEAFILQAEGNYTALRAIQKVAANSGFTVTIPEGFENDLTMIATLGRVPSMYCPADYLAEGKEVLPDIPHFADDGTVAYSADRPDNIYLLIRAGGLNSARKELSEISEKWSTAFVPQISELKPVKDAATGEVISTPEQQHTQAVEAAAETVDIKTTIKGLKADPDCQAVMDYYI